MKDMLITKFYLMMFYQPYELWYYTFEQKLYHNECFDKRWPKRKKELSLPITLCIIVILRTRVSMLYCVPVQGFPPHLKFVWVWVCEQLQKVCIICWNKKKKNLQKPSTLLNPTSPLLIKIFLLGIEKHFKLSNVIQNNV